MKGFCNSNTIIIILCVVLAFVNYHVFSQEKVKLVNSKDALEQGLKYYYDDDNQHAEEEFLKINRNDTNYVTALCRLAQVCYDLNKLDSAEQYAIEGIKEKSIVKAEFYLILAKIYYKKEKKEEAVKIIEEGLSAFPYNAPMHFTLAYICYDLHDYEKAETNFIKAITISPYNSSYHLHLGILNFCKNRIVPAAMCFNMAMLTSDDKKSNLQMIDIYEMLINERLKENLKKEGAVFKGLETNESFIQIAKLFKSGIALNKKFKSGIKLNYKVVRQNKLLFDELSKIQNGDDFYYNCYIRFFKEVLSKNFFEQYSYYVLRHVEDKQISSYIKKKKKKVNEFTEWAGGYIENLQKYAFDPQNEIEKKTGYYFYDNYNLRYMAALKTGSPETEDGPITGYYKNGNISFKGQYSDGKRKGEWRFYYEDGSLKEISLYADSLLEDTTFLYYKNGVVSEKIPYKAGKIQGEVLDYNKSGILVSSKMYKDDKLDGPEKYFFVNGALKLEYSNVNGVMSGPVKRYYNDGTLDMVSELSNDDFDGQYAEYHSNGKLYCEGTYSKGKKTGQWKYYYKTGQILKESNYNDEGEKSGKETLYHDNGKVSWVSVYDENGMKTGSETEYDKNGNLIEEYVYKNNILKSFICYDVKGNKLSECTENKDKIQMKGYHPNGNIQFEGLYVDNKKNGIWKYYNKLGVLYTEEEYENGNLNGKDIEYYSNGKIKNITTYKDDKTDGYCVSYYVDGQMSDQGWYVNDNYDGEWFGYYPNGSLKHHLFYVDGEKNGHNLTYSCKGKLSYDEYYDLGCFNQYVNYDTNEKVIGTYFLKNGNGELNQLYSNGKKAGKSIFLNSDYNDTVSVYNCFGKLIYAGKYVAGDKEGIHVWYNDDGKISRKVNYKSGSIEGNDISYYETGKIEIITRKSMQSLLDTTTWYYPNGNVETISTYKGSEREGFTTYYEPGGELVVKIYFEEDVPLYYTYLDKSGNFVENIPFKNDTFILVAYFKNGVKSTEIAYFNGERNGRRTFYYPDGKIMETGDFVCGYLHGPNKEYYSNGKLSLVENYYYGDLNGSSVSYYENGNIMKEMNYIFDDKHGEAKFYNQNGKLKKIQYYYDNSLLDEKIIKL